MSEKAPCALCGKEATIDTKVRTGSVTWHDVESYGCDNCGNYVIDSRLVCDWKNSGSDEPFKIACLVHQKQLAKKNQVYVIMDDGFEPTETNLPKDYKVWWRKSELLAEFPKPTEMVDRALANLARELPHPLSNVSMNDPDIYFKTFCKPIHQVRTLFKHMLEGNLLVAFKSIPHANPSYSISQKGWERIEQLKQPGVDSTQAFVAMSFDPVMDTTFQQGIKPAIKKTGFECLRMDNHEHINKICDEIVAEIRKSRFIIADFTGHRGGVYFEAGDAMGMGLPVIWSVHKDDLDNLHFDIRQYNHIVYETPEELKLKLQNRIAATIH